jgi:hypothetical protein
MKRLLWLLPLLWCCSPAWATFTLVNSSSGQSGRALNLTCAAAVCTLTIPSSGSGHAAILLIMDSSGSGITLSTVTGACASWVIDSSAHISNVAIGDNNGAYCLATSSGSTSVVATLSSSAGTVIAFYFEASFTGSSVAHDTAGTILDGAGATLAGVALTLAGTDMVGQMMQQSASVPASVTSPYNTNFLNTDGVSVYSFTAASVAFTSSGTAPTWTTTTGTPTGLGNAIALKEVAASNPANQFPRVQ